MATASETDNVILIAATVNDVACNFLSLVDVLQTDQSFASQITSAAIEDEFARFKVWAGNIGAHRRGHRSLEYRLRDAYNLKANVLSLLQDLIESIHGVVAIVQGHRIPWDAHEMPSSGSDSGSDISRDGFDGSTELKQLFSSIQSIVTSLFRLSMAIRDPAPSTQLAHTIMVDKSYFEEHDIAHVQSKYPDCTNFLTERLGRAISGRRQYLSYREEHNMKLSKGIEKVGLETLGTEHTANSTEATVKVTNDTEVFEEDGGESQTSFASSVNTAIRMPPLPKEAYAQKPYECPLCFMIISVHDKSAWKKHVLRDLHPYCCSFEDCTTADRLYDSRNAWFEHELQAHRASRVCVNGCERTFTTQHAFEHHIKVQHPELISLTSVLSRTSLRRANLMRGAICPMCNAHMSLKGLRKHLASHQQQLALFALPLQIDEEQAEDDGEYDQQNTADENDSDQSRHSGGVSQSGATKLSAQDDGIADSASSSPRKMTMTNNEMRLRVDGTIPLSLQLSGDMEGRTLQLVPAEDGMTDLIIGASGSSRRREDDDTAQKRKEEDEENVKNIRFDLSLPEARANERAEYQLAKKEKERVLAREEARRRKKKDYEEEAAKARKKDHLKNSSPLTTGRPATIKQEAVETLYRDTASAESLNQLYISDNVENIRDTSSSELGADAHTDGTVKRKDKRTMSPSRSCTPLEVSVAKGKSRASSTSLEPQSEAPGNGLSYDLNHAGTALEPASEAIDRQNRLEELGLGMEKTHIGSDVEKRTYLAIKGEKANANEQLQEFIDAERGKMHAPETGDSPAAERGEVGVNEMISHREIMNETDAVGEELERVEKTAKDQDSKVKSPDGSIILMDSDGSGSSDETKQIKSGVDSPGRTMTQREELDNQRPSESLGRANVYFDEPPFHNATRLASQLQPERVLTQNSDIIDSERGSSRPRPHSGEIVDWPQSKRVLTEISTANTKRGSLYEEDLALQRRTAKKYEVEVREPSIRDLGDHRSSGYYR